MFKSFKRFSIYMTGLFSSLLFLSILVAILLAIENQYVEYIEEEVSIKKILAVTYTYDYTSEEPYTHLYYDFKAENGYIYICDARKPLNIKDGDTLKLTVAQTPITKTTYSCLIQHP